MKICSLLLAASALASPAAAQTVAVVHAKAWTMQGDAPVPDATIVMANGRIISITSGGTAPAGATVIDAKGAPVTPGLMNGATQLGLLEVSSADTTRDMGSATDKIGPAFDVSRGLNGNSAIVDLARADGLTRALSFPGPSDVPPFSGQAATIRLRDTSDILDHSRAALFAVIGGNATKGLGSRAAQWEALRSALDEARTPGTSDAEHAVVGRRDAAAVRRVLGGLMPLAIVTHRESDIRQAAKLAADYHIRVVIVGGSEAWRAADVLAAAHIPVVLDPTGNMPATFDQLGTRQENAAILAHAGVTIAFGLVGAALNETYNAGLVLREGAGLAVASGLPYSEALRAITVNPAHIWEPQDVAGTLAPGAEADLVVWDGDPLEPSTNAVAVIIEGKPVSTENRQSMLARRYAGSARQ